jgi:hypothetical protein
MPETAGPEQLFVRSAIREFFGILLHGGFVLLRLGMVMGRPKLPDSQRRSAAAPSTCSPDGSGSQATRRREKITGQGYFDGELLFARSVLSPLISKTCVFA